MVVFGTLAVRWRAQAHSAQDELDAREHLCKVQIAAAIRELRSRTKDWMTFSDACDRAAAAEGFQRVYWPMIACFGSRGDWSNYRQHFDAALVLGDEGEAYRVLDALNTSLEQAGFDDDDMRYPSLGPPPKVPLCINM